MSINARRIPFPTEDVLHSERIFHLLVDSIQDYAIFLLTPQGEVASWNPGAERIKGYKPNEIIGKHFSKFYTPEDLATGKPAHELEVAAEVGRFEDEGWRVRKDGTKFWANVIISRVVDENGRLIGFGKVTRDLTARREAELQYKRLVEGVNDYAIYSLDASGRVTSWNSGAQGMKGYTPDEIVGQHFSMFYTPEDRAHGLPEQVLKTATTQGHYEGEGWRVRKDGSQLWSSVVVTAIRNEEGELVGFSKITRDVTEKKLLLDKLQEHSRELEVRIKEREQTNAELEAFSYSVSHDLRAPLRAIEGYSDIICEEFGDKLPAEAKQYLQEIVSSTTRMNRLVQDLLNYSRLSRIELKSEPVNVKAAIMDACGEIDPKLRSTISVSAEPNLRANAHGAMLRQVISNLLSNAVKFTKPGTLPKIDVSTAKRGRSVAIRIKDEGIGIAPQHQERVFQVFERLHGADEYPGTGIGLAIVKRAISRMGGTISIDSELGRGSTFTIMLPAA